MKKKNTCLCIVQVCMFVTLLMCFVCRLMRGVMRWLDLTLRLSNFYFNFNLPFQPAYSILFIHTWTSFIHMIFFSSLFLRTLVCSAKMYNNKIWVIALLHIILMSTTVVLYYTLTQLLKRIELYIYVFFILWLPEKYCISMFRLYIFMGRIGKINKWAVSK